jgi:hypothetical protein
LRRREQAHNLPRWQGYRCGEQPVRRLWKEVKRPLPDNRMSIAASFTQLIAAIERRPRAAFGWFLALHVLVWTALPTLLYHNLPLDLIEALTYGREWQLGYDKLPPLPWWLVEIAYRLVGHDFIYYLLAEVAVAAAFAGIWLTARPMVGAVGALCAILIVDGTHYLSYTAAKFNHDVIQLPFWALAGYAYVRALREHRLQHWVLLGFAVGMALWAKYFVIALVIPLLLFALIDREARQCWRRAGPYVAAAVAVAIIAPHLVWLVQNDFLPLGYAEARAAPTRGWFDHVLHPLLFVASQLYFISPTLLIALPFVWPQVAPAEPPADRLDRRIVDVLTFGPVATVLALSAVSGRGTVAMWGYPLWLFFGLWVVIHARNVLDKIVLLRVVTLWALIFAGLATGFVLNYSVLPYYDGRYRTALFPGERLAAELSRRFREATGEPLAYVIGSMWMGGNVAHYAPEHPRVLIDGKPARAPWIDLADLKARGAVVVWPIGDRPDMPPEYAAVAQGAIVQPPLRIPFRATNRELTVGWAIVPPQDAPASPR